MKKFVRKASADQLECRAVRDLIELVRIHIHSIRFSLSLRWIFVEFSLKKFSLKSFQAKGESKHSDRINRWCQLWGEQNLHSICNLEHPAALHRLMVIHNFELLNLDSFNFCSLKINARSESLSSKFRSICLSSSLSGRHFLVYFRVHQFTWWSLVPRRQMLAIFRSV